MKLPRAHHLPVAELAGQVLMPTLNMKFINKNSPVAWKIIRAVRESQVAGFILFGGHPADVRHWTDFLQRESKYPLLFAADLERGSKSVFSNGAMFPHHSCFGASGNKQLVIDFAEVVAREARAVGLNVVFAPVLDVADYPDNPIINIRSWHSDPEVVGEYGRSFIESVQKFGIACVGKHFPGHGSTQTDSHVDLPVLKKRLAQLEKEDLIPFRKACAVEAKGIMAGHLKLEEYDYPASMEPKLIQNLLRNQWKYDGVVFTDSLAMGAITNHYKPWQQSFYPINAGADILLMPQGFHLDHQILQKEIQSSKQFRKKAEAAVDRVFRLKKWIHRQQPAQAHPSRIYKVVEHPDHKGLAQRIAEESITLIHRSKRFPLYLPAIESVKHIIFTDTKFDDQPLKHFCVSLEQFFDSVETLNNPSPQKIQSLAISKKTVVTISIYFRTFAGHEQKLNWESVNQIVKNFRNSKIPMIIFLFGNPYHIKHLKSDYGADAVFLTYSYVEVSQHAAFRALGSMINIKGKLPVKLKLPFDKSIRLSERTYRLERAASDVEWKEVDKTVENAIRNKFFPGGVVLAANRGKFVYHKAYGKFNYDRKSPDVKPDTLYDLASLTKVLATTPAIMRLVENGTWGLEHKLSDFYPRLQKDEKGGITVSNLLAHQSGFPAWKPFYEEFQPESCSTKNRSIIIEQILDMPLEHKTGEKAVYSDLGFIVLLDIIESLTGVSFDAFCREQIFEPMGLASLHFNPDKKNKNQIPPTGKDEWRGSIVQGEVNDNNCFMMGGVSTHSGLFGTAQDVAALGQMFIQKGIYNKERHFKQKTIDLFGSPMNPKISNRALGWDTPDKNGSSGKLISKESIGHLGFTGGSLWVELKKEIIVVFLCNRVHPDPQRNRMDEFRPRLHDAIMTKLLK